MHSFVLHRFIVCSLLAICNAQTNVPVLTSSNGNLGAEPTSIPTETPTKLTYITCVTRHSVPSGIGVGAYTNVGCNDGEALTSCGFNAISSTDYFNHPGSFVLNSVKYNEADTCNAQNYGAGVQAHARCCSFTPYVTDFSCVGYDINHDDAGTQTIACNDTSHKYLTGCSALSSTQSSEHSTMLGMIPNDIWVGNAEYNKDYPMIQQICSSYDNYIGPPDGGSRATVVCCNSPSYDLNCVTRYNASSVVCGAGYHMTGCSARIKNDPAEQNIEVALNGWYISDDNECITQGDEVYAIAICCKLETDAPTFYPTTSPTAPTTPYPTLRVGTLSPARKPTKKPIIKDEAEQKEDTTQLPTIATKNGFSETDDKKENTLLTVIWVMTVSLVLLLLIVVLLVLYKRKDNNNNDTPALKDVNNHPQSNIAMTSSVDIPGKTTTLQVVDTAALYKTVSHYPDLPEDENKEEDTSEGDESDSLYDAHITTDGMDLKEDMPLNKEIDAEKT